MCAVKISCSIKMDGEPSPQANILSSLLLCKLDTCVVVNLQLSIIFNSNGMWVSQDASVKALHSNIRWYEANGPDADDRMEV